MTDKTQPIQLPIDPRKTYVMRFVYGFTGKEIAVSGDEVNFWKKYGWELIAEAPESERLQEFDAQNPTEEQLGKVSPILGQVAPIDEPLVLVIGELYEYKTPHPHIKEWRHGKLISLTDKAVVLQKDDGDYKVLQRNCTEIRKHTPKPVEHEISFWVNFYSCGAHRSFDSKKYADIEDSNLSRNGKKDRIACLNFKRAFVEGEGL